MTRVFRVLVQPASPLLHLHFRLLCGFSFASPDPIPGLSNGHLKSVKDSPDLRIAIEEVQGVRRRCRALIKRVNVFVGRIIEEHNERRIKGALEAMNGDFVDILLDLQLVEKLSDSDIINVVLICVIKSWKDTS